MAADCEQASAAREGAAIRAVGAELWKVTDRADWPQRWHRCIEIEEYFGAALAILPPGTEWRKYTDLSCSVYAASPYNAKAQVRHDGDAKTPALALMAANLKLRGRQMQAVEARSAGK